ncbi:MAG TPA: XRE family transcriptional regulator [Lachnospiraceae bacterium]|nr:XRE family transcriptional regulator [Lachnospiraceae bacterium]
MDNNQVYDFGLRLRQLREDRGFSKAAFAKKLGVSAETVYRYENNTQYPSLERTKQIAVILRTSVDYLVGLDNEYTVKFPNLSKEQRYALNLFLRAFVDGKIIENSE